MKIVSMSLIIGMILSLCVFSAVASDDEQFGRRGYYGAKFYGVVESMPGNGWEGVWIVNGRKILVTRNTKIEEEYGRADVGAYVEVKGNYSGKTFTAYEIEVKGERKNYREKSPHNKSYNSRFSGSIEIMPQDGYEGVWIIDGRKVEVTPETFIDETHGKATVGSRVKVKGVRTGKVITAYEIEVSERKR